MTDTFVITTTDPDELAKEVNASIGVMNRENVIIQYSTVSGFLKKIKYTALVTIFT